MSFQFRNRKQERDMELAIMLLCPIQDMMQGKKLDYDVLRSIYKAGFEAGREDQRDWGDERPPIRVIDRHRSGKTS